MGNETLHELSKIEEYCVEEYDNRLTDLSSMSEWSSTYQCASYEKCKNTLELKSTYDNYNSHDVHWSCPYIKDNVAEINPNISILMIFLSLLWVLPLIQDIEESSTEEKVLDHYIA